MLKVNYDIFQKLYPEWLKEIENARPDYKYEIIKAKSGDITLFVEKESNLLYFHSQYDPKKEASKLIQNAIDREPEVLIIGGIGMGYLVESALSTLKKSHIVVCDFDWGILKSALDNRTLDHIFSNPRCHFIFTENPQALIDILKPFQTKDIKLFIHQPSSQLHPEYFNKLKSTMDNYQNTKEINSATLNRFQKLWSKNILKNIIPLITFKGVIQLFNQYNNIPCVIVAAGPSLKKNIHLLREIKNKALIIAVDTTFQILQAYNIEPDFVIAVDPQDINKKYFENIKKTNAILICEPSISPKIIQNYPGKKLMLGSIFHLVKWLEGITNEKGEIDIGGSVATAAFGLAMKMGCDPVIFVGLDLAYSDGETHMKGAYFEENWLFSWNKYRNINGLSYLFLKKFGLFKIPGHQGTTVYSDRKFHMFLTWFESHFKKSNRNIIDATEGGAKKDHCTSLSFKEAIDRYIINQSHNISEIHEKILNDLYEKNHTLLLNKVLNELILVQNIFLDLNQKIVKGLFLSKELYDIILKSIKYDKKYPQRIVQIHHELDKIDSVIAENKTINALISITIQNIISDIDDNKDDDLSPLEKENSDLKTAKQTLKLYEGIKEGIQFNIEQLSKTIFRLKTFLNKVTRS